MIMTQESTEFENNGVKKRGSSKKEISRRLKDMNDEFVLD